MIRRWGRPALVGLSLAAALAIPLFLALRAGLPPGALLSLPWQAHLAGGLVLAVEVLARAWRLVSLARALGVPLRMRTALLAQLSADAAGTVTPARSGSEPAKLLSMRRDGGGMGGVAAVAAGELAFEVLGLAVVASVFVVALPDGTRAALAVLAYAGVVAAVVTTLYVVAGRGRSEPPGWWRRVRLSEARWRWLMATASEFRTRARALPHIGTRAALATGALTLLHQLAKAATFPALAWGAGLGDLVDPGPGAGGLPWARLFVVPFSILYLGALLPPPGGGGGVEIGFAALLGDALPAAQLPVLLLWWRAYTHYVSAVVGGLAMGLLLLRRRRVGTGAPGSR